MMKLTIAGLCLAFRLDGFESVAALRQRYQYFLSDDEPDWDIGLQPVGVTDDVVEQFTIREPEPGEFRLQRRDVDVVFKDARATGIIQDSDHSFDMLLRGLLNLHAGLSGLLMCHAAVLSRAGRAEVFMGRPNAGKTTLCRAAPEECQVLSDEVAFLRPAGLKAAGSPFLGEIHGPRCRDFLPLNRVNEIVAHGGFQSRPLTGVATMPALLRHSINFGPETSLSASFFATAADLTRRITVYSLRLPEKGFWEVYNV